jgi:glycosyltransferase involved in cell wall biosynthesis
MPTYAVITPVRDEAENLPRLAAALAAQTSRPGLWLVVDNGSTDGTLALAHGLAAEHGWLRVLTVPGTTAADRGAPVVRALHAAIEELAADPPDIVVNVDADVSMEPDYFECLLARFVEDTSLGIASGSAFELEDGAWKQRYVTGSTVWGASRAFRWECLQQILPFEERVAWDGIDEFKANARGWRTHAFEDLPFRHHRPEGVRDGGALRARRNQGHSAYYVGYRPWYLVLRSLWNARREPAALGLIWGYAAAAVKREPRSADTAARAYLRRQQSVRRLRLRSLEATGRRDRAV